MSRRIRFLAYASSVMALVLTGCLPEGARTAPPGSSGTPVPSTTRELSTSSTAAHMSSSTMPATADSLLVIGDWGSGSTAESEVTHQMMDYADSHDVTAILTTGDNFYSNQDDLMMEPFEWAVDDGIPFWITWGNHDVESRSRIELVEKIFDDPPRWAVHRWGPIDVVILDSNQASSQEQQDFFTETLAAGLRPTIVVFHHPPYSCGSHGDTRIVQERWVPLFDQDVFLALSGHEHTYQRFETADVTYVVTGGGGASLTELKSCSDDHPKRIVGESVHHFLILELDDDLTVTVVDGNGDVIDEFELPLP